MRKQLLTTAFLVFLALAASAQCTTPSTTIVESFSANAVPACWTLHGNYTQMSWQGNPANYYISMVNNNQDQLAVMPMADNAQGVLTVDIAMMFQNGLLIVDYGVMTDPNDPATFYQVGTRTLTASQGVFDTFTFYFNLYSGSGQYIAIRFRSSQVVNYGNILLDNFNYESECLASTSVTAITQDITVQLDENGEALVSPQLVNNGSVDGCGDPAQLSLNQVNFTCSDIGDNTVTLLAYDNNGNSDQETATVTIEPYIEPSSSVLTASLDANGNASVNNGDVNLTGCTQCTGLTYELAETSFDCSDIGTFNVTLNAIYAGNVVGTGLRTIQVVDEVAPTIAVQNITVSVGANGSVTITPAMVDNGTVDNCSQNLTLSLSQTEFTCSDVGANVVTFSAEDEYGNIATQDITVTVQSFIEDQSVSANTTQFCTVMNTGSLITVASSQVGVDYYLRDQNDVVVEGPIPGNGQPITFQTGILTADDEFNVYAEKPQSVTNNFALEFDGQNDKVASSVNYGTATNTFTLEAWVYPESTSYKRIISSYGTGAAGEVILDTYNTTNNGRALRLYVVGNNGTFIYSLPDVLTLNEWNHIAAVFDNGIGKLYRNGALVGTSQQSNVTTLPGTNYNFQFGEDRIIGAAEYWNGRMDEIRFWNTARTEQEIADNYNICLQGNEPGLKEYFKLDEGAGGDGTIVQGEVQYSATLSNFNAQQAWAFGADINCGGSLCTRVMTQTIPVTVTELDLSVSQNGGTLTANQSGATYQWWNCEVANGAQQGETNQSFTPSYSASFAVEVTLNGCSDFSDCVQMVVTDVDESLSQINVYPIPAQDVLTLNTTAKVKAVSIYAIDGSLVINHSQSLNKIDVSELKSGVYLLQVICENGVSQTRFIKE